MRAQRPSSADATREPGYGDPAKPLAGVIDQDGLEVSRLYQVDVSNGQGGYLTPDTLHVYEFGTASRSREIAFLAAPPPGEASWPRSRLYTVAAARRGSSVQTTSPRLLLNPQTVAGPLHGVQMAIPRLSGRQPSGLTLRPDDRSGRLRRRSLRR